MNTMKILTASEMRVLAQHKSAAFYDIINYLSDLSYDIAMNVSVKEIANCAVYADRFYDAACVIDGTKEAKEYGFRSRVHALVFFIKEYIKLIELASKSYINRMHGRIRILGWVAETAAQAIKDVIR